MAAACVHSLRGDTCAGSGELFGLYLRNGLKRWMYRSWKNMLCLISIIEGFAMDRTHCITSICGNPPSLGSSSFGSSRRHVSSRIWISLNFLSSACFPFALSMSIGL